MASGKLNNIWIPSYIDLAKHRKLLRLAHRLRASALCHADVTRTDALRPCDMLAVSSVSIAAAIGYLHQFWYWIVENAPDGCLNDLEYDVIAAGSGWPFDATAFVEALIEAGFVDTENGLTQVHQWDQYAGKCLRSLARDAERQRRHRASKGRNADVTRMSRGHNADVHRTSQGDMDMDMVPPCTQSTVPPNPEIDEFFAHFKERILPGARLFDKGRKKIATRLKSFSLADMKLAVDHFAADHFCMTHNAHRGVAWFCENDERIAGYIAMTPRKEPGNGADRPARPPISPDLAEFIDGIESRGRG